MRLHHLEICGFGPFADSVAIDFDDVGEAGLFLLSGPTGSGKSSILDAICFALYGRVAGERERAGHHRSDHAGADQPSSVQLECTLGQRRIRIRRTPQWLRPKKRGDGVTKQQASAVLQVQRDGQWHTLSTRLDEIGDQIGAWLGLRLDQFLQVAMLPQGGFHAFLTASADDRKRLLERLFRTESYVRIEQGLNERRRQAATALEGARTNVRETAARFGEATQAQTGDTLLGADEIDQIGTWVGSVLSSLRSEVDQLSTLEAQALVAHAEAEAALSKAAQIAERQAMALDSQTRLEQLQDLDQQIRRDRDRLAVATKAAQLATLLRLADEAEHHRDHAAEVLAEALAHCGDELEALPSAAHLSHLDESAKEVSRQAVLAEAFIPDQRRLTRLCVSLEASEGALHSARLRRARLEGELAAAHQDIEQLHTTMSAHTADIEAGIAAAQVVAECDDLVAHLRLGEELQSHRSLLAQHLQLAKADEQLQREEWLRAREARVAGMAAELATQLAVGGECPVCGSCEHPHRATRTPTHVDDATETAARRRYETAASTLQTLREEHSALTAKLSAHAARHRGDSLSEVIARQHEAQLHVDRAEQARGRLVLANTRLEGLQETARSRQSEVEQIDAEISGLEQTMAETEVSIAELRLRLHTLLSQHDTDDVERLADDLRARRELLHDALSAFAEHNRAAQAAQDQLRALLDAAASHGFDTIDQVREALLDQESTAELSHRVVRHDEDVASCLAVLNQPEIAAALRQAAPDLDVLAAAEQQTATELGDLHVALSHANGQLIRGTDLADTLSRQLRGIAPLREQADLTRELATLVDGKGPNNDLRISLSAYVLAQRLRQVVAAANDRLGRMSDHRYHLQHTEERGARERQGGLGLLVVDDWTGIARAPETLSGGESFIVSLALALGLADVVTYEVGGVEIGTLFVDEGFGSLDPDSLEQVLDVLDELRSGGRVVGVVSHVVGMRERIPTRLDVVKGRNGSTVRRSA